MNILHITAQKPNSTGSGVFMSELVCAFNTLGHTQAVVAGIYREDCITYPDSVHFFPVYYKSRELPYSILGMSDVMPYDSTRYSDLTAEMVVPFKTTFLNVIDEAISVLSPDIIICHHLYLLTSYVSLAHPHIPIYGQCHGSDLRQYQKNPLLRNEIATGIRSLDGVFALHQLQAQEIASAYHISPDKIHVMGSGYNASIFYPNRAHITDHNNSSYTIIYAGKLCHEKGVMEFLRSLDLLPYNPESCRVQLAGSLSTPSEQQQIEALISACRYPVELLGLLNHKELASALNQADVFILPSFYEGLPLVLMEALACGCQVICTNLPGIQEWYDTFIPHHHITFIEPPALINVDEPVAESIPLFHQSIANQIMICSNTSHITTPDDQSTPDLRQVTWIGLAKRILNFLC